jgi:hypothetical protein
VSNNATVSWNVTAGNVYVNGNTSTGNLESRGNVTAVDTISVSNTTTGNGIIAATANIYGNNIVAKANVLGTNAVLTQNTTSGNVIAANVIVSEVITVSNVTTGNGVAVESANIYGNNIIAKANFAGSNAVLTQNVSAGNIAITQNTTTGNLVVTQNTSSGNVSAANVIVSQVITVSNVTTGNGVAVESANVYANNFVAKNNVLAPQINATTNLNTSYLGVSTLANVACANITTLFVETLTVTNPIAAPAETDSSSYRLRASATTRGDGAFGVRLGSSANGNAWINFDTVAGNVWRLTANSTEGTYYTILTRQNLSDSITTTDSTNAGSLTAVKSAADIAKDAYASSNLAANTVAVYANDAVILEKSNVNFNNSASINVAAGVHGSFSNRSNVAFTLNTASISSIGTLTTPTTLATNVTVSQSLNVSGNITGTLKSTKDYLNTSTVSGTVTVDLNGGNWFKYTLSGTPTFTFANAPASGTAMTVTLLVLQNGTGGYTPAWGNTIYWAGGLVPPASTGANKLDMWTFTTTDGGTSFIGTLAVKDAR